ncbi:hypothetical protein E4O00_05645 [Treponema sp. OMZ 788]|uniref:hypothetical protein n=1 Tax=Treponema sp. OMZ 788 TaxID=2563664 RepID=UPI0020A4343D|nr:hypothetical protein [Treponema sp. OMZ 788]UTC65579.1 hypothetical protein E4O00_05645 [Treponema sp. OMZ 788]
MKKILLPVLFFALIFSSCSLFFQDEYGTVTIDLEGGNARSINSSTGLPNIADSELEIEIAMGGTRSLYKKILASEPKFFQANFPIGARLEINIKLNGPSALWSANAKHTVKEGNNDIQLLLNKNASALATLSFSVNDDESNEYEFNIAGRTIEISSADLPVFTRDSRGRLYIAYKKDNDWKLNRYESDGTLNNFASSSDILTKIASVSSVKLASDPITGKVYAASNSKLYLIKDDGSTIETQSGGAAIPEGLIAVYNNNLFVLDLTPAAPNNNLKMFTITEGGRGLTLIPVGSPISILKQQIKINSSPPIINPIKVNFINILIKNNSIYILFEAKTIPGTSSVSPYYSLGGMLEYNYDSNGLKDNPKDYGFDKEITYNLNDSVITTSQDNFYGAVSFIGYDEQNIYIADDGCTLKKESNNVKIDKNVNRIFSFNTSTKTLSYSATENKWFEEHKSLVSPPPSPITGKVLLWEKNSNPNLGMVYYQVNYKNDEGNYDNLLEAFIKGKGSSSLSSYKQIPTDIFSYDNLGNLYAVWKIEGSPTHKYVVKQYLWDSSTSNYVYDKEANLYFKGNQGLNIEPDAIAIISDTNNYLYYTYKANNNTFLLRLKWNTNFAAALKDPSFEQKIKDAGGSKSFCTALAVNENGIFAAVKNIAGSDINYPDNYSVNIKKYKHTNSADGETLANNIVPQIDADNYTLEDICDLQIKGGVLYGIKTKKTGKLKEGTTSKVSTSGELFKIEALDSSFSSSTVVTSLWSSSSQTDGYAPYRFIGTVPSKLLIASDGYYVKKTPNQIENKNKVLSFDINTASTNWTVTPKDTNATFSRELMYTNGTGFDWK